MLLPDSWFIDAVHFVLMHYERGVYARVSRNSTKQQIAPVKLEA